jgi:hypothetical protein
MPIDGSYIPGERKVFCAVIDQAAVEKHMLTNAVERYLYAIYDKETGRNVGHLWLNKTKDANQLKDIPFGAIVQFEAEVAEYRARNDLFELRNISQVKMLRKPTLARVLEMHDAKDADRVRRGLNFKVGVCAQCGSPTASDIYRGYSSKGMASEFCTKECRTQYLKANTKE